MRNAVPPCGTAGGAEQVRGAGTAPPPEPSGSQVLTTRASRTAPDDRPADPAASRTLPHTRRRLERVIGVDLRAQHLHHPRITLPAHRRTGGDSRRVEYSGEVLSGSTAESVGERVHPGRARGPH